MMNGAATTSQISADIVKIAVYFSGGGVIILGQSSIFQGIFTTWHFIFVYPTIWKNSPTASSKRCVCRLRDKTLSRKSTLLSPTTA
jgi:hypothetical protein